MSESGPRPIRRTVALAALVAATAVLSTCGGGDRGGSTSSSGGDNAAAQKAVENAKVAPTLAEAKDATGTVNFCTGTDTTGGIGKAIDQFNAKYARQGLKAKIVEFPESADEQRQQFVQRQEARSGECDAFQADIIWTAEFAQQGWIQDLTAYVEQRKDEFIPSTLEAVKYGGRYWGVPQVTGAGLLYYRTDQVPEVPATWQELYAKARDANGIAYQGAAYEGLTCNFLEVAFAAGGRVLSDDGTKAAIDSPENLRALQLMVDGVRRGAAPKGVTTYMEEQARRAFEGGAATFMRNWSYAYALDKKAPKLRGRFDVAPLPAFEGGGRAGVLGGNGPVISTYARNPKGALLFVDFFTSAAVEKQNGAEFALPPVLNATYADPDVKKAIPYAAELKQAVEQAKPRPASPVYPQISQAIYENVNRALSGEVTPEEALKRAQEEMNRALATF